MTLNKIENDKVYELYLYVAKIFIQLKFSILYFPPINYYYDDDNRYGYYKKETFICDEWVWIRDHYGHLRINLSNCTNPLILSATYVHEVTHYKQDVFEEDLNHKPNTNAEEYNNDPIEKEARKMASQFIQLVRALYVLGYMFWNKIKELRTLSYMQKWMHNHR